MCSRRSAFTCEVGSHSQASVDIEVVAVAGGLLEATTKTHHRQCAYCEPLRRSVQVVGMGSKSSVRNVVVQFYGKPVPKEVRAACGYVFVLTIVEITTGDTMYLPRKTEGAAEVALLFQTR